MSMLSAMCDRLRERAKELRNLAPDPDIPYLVPSTKETMAMAMKSVASEMEGAADTIWELRNKLAGMVDERDRARLAEAENAKLRELVRDMWRKNLGRMDNPCSWCVMGCAGDDCDFERRMRELGIEVEP